VSIIVITLCTDDDNSFSERPEYLELYDENVPDTDVVNITDRINAFIEQIESFPSDEIFNDNQGNGHMESQTPPTLKTIVNYFVGLKVTLEFICSRKK